MPALKGIDRLARHDADERSLKVERFGFAPVEPDDGIERRRHSGRRADSS